MVEGEDELGFVVGEHFLGAFEEADGPVEFGVFLGGVVEEADAFGLGLAFEAGAGGVGFGAEAARFDVAFGSDLGGAFEALVAVHLGFTAALFANLGEEVIADGGGVVEAAQADVDQGDADGVSRSSRLTLRLAGGVGGAADAVHDGTQLELGGVGVEEVGEEGVAELGLEAADDLGAEVLLGAVEGAEAANEAVDGVGVGRPSLAPIRQQMKTSNVSGSVFSPPVSSRSRTSNSWVGTSKACSRRSRRVTLCTGQGSLKCRPASRAPSKVATGRPNWVR